MKGKHSQLIEKIKGVIYPFKYYIEKQDGIGLLQVFNKENLIPREYKKFRIANADIIVFDDNDKPFLIIEPETSGSPKTFGRSISVYTIAKKVKIGNDEYPIPSPLLLLIVIPQQNSQKKDQLDDLNEKLRTAIGSENSQLRDFAICQIDDMKPVLKKLLEAHGYKKYGSLID